ncbi:MAG: 7-cyano-7-deazaguanine synthase QueC [Pseudomonadota bacterium]
MRKLDKNKALVVFSGGQDSSIALIWALQRYQAVETIGFDYGQRHAIELGARRSIRRGVKLLKGRWADRLGDDRIVFAGGLKDVGETAMTAEHEIETGDHSLPTTFVPGRNLHFLVLAGAFAYQNDIGVIVAGMCETDYSGYPDCRADTLAAQIQAIQLGMDCDIQLETPLMNISKAESWRLLEREGGSEAVELVNEESHTCYRGVRSQRHVWGYGCDDCPACSLRKKGWAVYAGGVKV